MADTALTVRGDGPTTLSQAGTLISATSHGATAAGDYLLAAVSAPWVNPASLAIEPSAGVDGWAEVARSQGYPFGNIGWLARVTADGPRTVSIRQNDYGEIMNLHVYTLDVAGGTVTVDGLSTMGGTSDGPYTHGSLNPAGTRNLLVAAHGALAGSATYNGSPAGMSAATSLTETIDGSNDAVMQTAVEQLDSGGATGTRAHSLNVSAMIGHRGWLLALRNDADTAPVVTEAAVLQGWGVPHPSTDEFDSPGPPDPAKWSVYGAGGNVGGDECWVGHDGNGRRCVDRVTVTDDGYLRISGTPGGDTGAVSHRFDQQYGRWEVRARALPVPGATGNPYHAVAIVWPWSNKWPVHGEYDFWEVDVGDTDATAWLHYPHPGPVPIQQERGRKAGVDVAAWHNYALEWTPDALIGYLDGIEWFRFGGGAGPNGRGPIQGMPAGHLTLQLDDFFPDAGLQPAYLDVDWARVYEAPVPGPGVRVVDVGEQSAGVEFTVTADELGDGITARSWTILSGPSDAGTVLSTTDTLTWTPPAPGRYEIEYRAVNTAGSSADQLRVDVTGAEAGRMLLAT